MIAAKHNPGEFNVPYVDAMNISSIHTGVLKTDIAIASAAVLTGGAI